MSSFADVLIIPVALFIIGLVLIFSIFIFNTFADADASIFGAYKTQINQAFNVIGVLIPLLMLGMTLGAIVSAMLIRTHPIFLGVSILLMVIQILITPALANMWQSIITADAGISDTADTLPFLIFIFQNLPLITIVISFLVGTITYLRGME
jgi:hypothetical protein